jgi:hypothetical protein
LYGCGTWLLKLRKQEKLRILDSRVLREVFMSEGKELAGYWRKLRKWELHYSFWSTNAIGGQAKEDEMVEEHLEFCGEKRKPCKKTTVNRTGVYLHHTPDSRTGE